MPDRWLPFAQQRVPSPRFRLFCLPCAGGSAATYRAWVTGFPADIEVCPVQLAGRASRRTEPVPTSAEQHASDLVDLIIGMDDVPFAIFGHSMGGLLAFETARLLRRVGGPMPFGLVVAGAAAPDLWSGGQDRFHTLDDDGLLEVLRDYGGTPPEILGIPELVALALPILRADLQVCETYEYQPGEPLSIPISVLGGSRDSSAGLAKLRAWDSHTVAGVTVRMFEGEHFFLQDAFAEVRAAVVADLIRFGAADLTAGR